MLSRTMRNAMCAYRMASTSPGAYSTVCCVPIRNHLPQVCTQHVAYIWCGISPSGSSLLDKMRPANPVLLLLALMLPSATADLVVNPYTIYHEPPPDAIDCSSDGNCQGHSECSGAYCADLNGRRTCMDKLTSGSDSVPANACDDPQANGFIKCEAGLLYRHCSARNRDGGMFDTTGLQFPSPPPPDGWSGIDAPPKPPPAPGSPPPDFSNQLEGQLFFLGCGLFFLLIVAILAYLFHVRWQMGSGQLKRSADDASKGINGLMRKGRGQALTFFTRWVSIENGLEVFVEFLNYAASITVAMGSPNSFYIAFGVNVGMIVLELFEHCRTRRNGGKQTPWDRFWFGQWTDATRKNYYAKYNAPSLLFAAWSTSPSFPSACQRK